MFNNISKKVTIYIYKRLRPRKKIRNRKKERAATEKKKEPQEQFF